MFCVNFLKSDSPGNDLARPGSTKRPGSGKKHGRFPGVSVCTLGIPRVSGLLVPNFCVPGVYPSQPQDISTLCGRLVLLDARKAGEGLPMGTQVSNSRLTVVLRSQVLDRRDRLRLLWILTPQPAGLTDYFNPVRAIIVDPSLERSPFRPPFRISFSQQQHVRTVYPSALSSWKSFGKIISPIHNI